MRVGKIRISSEARNIVVIFSVICMQCIILRLWLPGLITLGALGFILFFFRDPDRIGSDDPNTILSAADGTIVDISEVFEEKFFQQPVRRVGIFLSIFDVHVNRAPISGEIKYLNYQRGRFKNALSGKASQYNEHNLVGIDNGTQRVLVKQIAGMLARRIVCYLGIGETVSSGARIGLIKFGSRVEIFIPKEAELRVKLRDKVKAGETIIAVLTPSKE
ncbi:MAG: phosphatidylserine decarboxylase family protein [bacterium]|nr:phosphatidylserine decarboxylase family protein [bacterium]